METMSSGDEKHEKTCRIPNRKTSQEDLRHHPPTIEFLLKQVFSLHNKKIRGRSMVPVMAPVISKVTYQNILYNTISRFLSELKTQIKELKSELQNALIRYLFIYKYIFFAPKGRGLNINMWIICLYYTLITVKMVIEVSFGTFSNVNCLRCENERQNQQELTHHYEKLLQEKDQLIRQLSKYPFQTCKNICMFR